MRSVRDQSIQVAKLLGVDVLPTLPLLEEGLQLRSPAEATARLLAMTAVAASGYGFDKAKAAAWLEQEGLVDALTEEERLFVFQGEGEAEPFRLQVEGLWALAWALGPCQGVEF